MGRGRRRNNGPTEDQFGAVGESQDKELHGGGRHTSGGGMGGSAGGGGRGGGLIVTRHIPKFLQSHAHLLGVEQPDAGDELVTSIGAAPPEKKSCIDADDYQEEDEMALRLALEQDPSLIARHPELVKIADRAQAASFKDRGNAAFTAKKYEEAIDMFSECIRLNPQDAVFWSNRAAGYIAIKAYSKAVDDARQAVKLNPGWVKGYARLGAALLGISDGAEAKEALQQALSLEPNDEALKAQLTRAIALESQQIAAGQHIFKKRSRAVEDGLAAKRQALPIAQSSKAKQLLSFEDNSDEQND